MKVSAPNIPLVSIITLVDEPAWFEELTVLTEQVRALKPVLFRRSLADFYSEATDDDISGASSSELNSNLSFGSFASAVAADVCLLAFEGENDAVNLTNLDKLLREFENRGLSIPVIVIARWRGADNGVGALQRGAADYLIRAAMRPTMIERSLRFALEREKQRKAAEGMRKESLQIQSLASGDLAPDLFQMRTIFEQLLHKLTKVKDARGCTDLAKRGLDILNVLLPPSANESIEELEEQSLNQIVQDAVELLRRILRGSIDIDCELPDYDLRVAIDSTELQEALIELALNSQEAMLLNDSGEADTLEPRLIIKLVKTGKQVAAASKSKRKTVKQMACLVFQDTGEGIDPVSVEEVMNPTIPAKKGAREFSLGLSSVKRTVERIGGSIEIFSHRSNVSASSRPPRSKDNSDIDVEAHGTTVKLWIPLKDSEYSYLPDEGTGKVSKSQSELRCLYLFSDDEELAEMISAYAIAASGHLVSLSTPNQLTLLFGEHSVAGTSTGAAAKSPGLLVVDTNKMSASTKPFIEEIVTAAKVKVVFVGEDANSLVRSLCDSAAIPYYRRPDELVLLATRLSE
jgi:signal transduction histidine kinase